MGGYVMGSNDEFKPLNNKEIMEIINVLNESDFDELRLELTGFKLILSKNVLESPHSIPEPLGDKEQGRVSIGQPPPDESEQERQGDVPAGPEDVAQDEEEGLIPIKAPLLGIFYRSPKPGAPPFVEVGDSVTEDDTICLIEVMKCFNTVKADVKGRIVKICAENNQMVEYNQTLYLIDPAGKCEGT
jgi:acetyl-CoA carboxylase biotin carboxyl carrier protein